MRIEDFNTRLRDSILVADGAMGSMLYEVLGPQRCFDEVNLTGPEAVFRIHQAYISAGAQLIKTNTFGANRHKLAPHGLADSTARINHAGVKVAREAREAAAREVLIAGSIGPLGMALQVSPLPAADVLAIFREQAAALEERGADLFLLETFGDLDELLLAIDAIRSFSRLPIIAEMTFSEEIRTLGGLHPRDVWEKVKEKDVQAMGANCTIGPQLLLGVIEEWAPLGPLPLSAMPNVGFPKRMGDRITYPKSSPEYFALFAREAAAFGVRVIGGCCGTTPEHIRAIAEAVAGYQPGQAARSPATVREPRTDTHPILARAPESGIWRRIGRGEFVVSVEIDPPKGISCDRVFEQVARLVDSGQVHAIDINSGTLARVGMDALVLAGALEARGVETIPHLTTRDLNVIGLQAMLLGAWSVGGVRNVLAITGDPPSLGDHPETSGVYEVDSVGLVKILARLNQGMDWAGKTLGGATNFTIAVAVNPVADDLDYEIARFRQKIEAGAHLAMTQPLFDPEQWHAFEKRLGGKCPIPVLAGVWPLTSAKQAMRLNNEVPGIVIPEPVLKDLEAAGAAARERGFAIARRMLDWARTALDGVYLIAPFKRYEEILEIFI
ncbi:MAG TPA: bifunctional homocysteine S-methyltransferase/methylenetetrahydrofolate reductase [Candidatus Acidoferrales bacterium]|nr:bifunctional homocysteine S-methyltransferase/methylenetetrahydrofolate reductase [Candidatus Acidoferrales bacterium]